MKIKKITVAALAATTTAALTAAVPEVTSVVMAQSSASREVTITYTLADASAVVTLEVQTNANTSAAADDPGWTSIGGAAVANAKGDVWKQVATGSHTITWRPDLSWPDHKIEDGGARAVLTAWALDNTPDYMVVDITATGGAGTEKYYPGADFVPRGVTNDLYKTGSLLMRKIMAKDVTWMMGSVKESGRNADREESHQVTLTNNYYIGVFEVTQTQWQRVTGYNPSVFKAEDSMRPVDNVCYRDIRCGKGTSSSVAPATAGVYPDKPADQSFLGLLRSKTQIDFDLPSEAQWEFAARAGNGEGYWGDGSPIQISSDKDANLDLHGRYLNNPSTNSSSSPDTETIAPAAGGTAIVGSYLPNGWGLYDMNGNVYEFCLDFHEDDITDLNGAVNMSGSLKVRRGGAWSVVARHCRPAWRVFHTLHERDKANGLRLVCTAGLQ